MVFSPEKNPLSPKNVHDANIFFDEWTLLCYINSICTGAREMPSRKGRGHYKKWAIRLWGWFGTSWYKTRGKNEDSWSLRTSFN